MTKKALAEKAGMGISTLRYYMNVKYIDKLKEMDYYPRQKYLTPKQVHFLCEELVIVDDD